MHYKELAERARYYKKDSKGVEAMCEIWEEVRSEGIAESRAEGRAEGKAEDIKSLMNRKGWSIEDAMDALGIPEGEWNAYRMAVQE